MSKSPDSSFVADRKPLAGRECGTCSKCCNVYFIPELDKPKNTWCPHVSDTCGCRIWPDRPKTCSAFFCLWTLDPRFDERWKPELAGFVMSTIENGSQLQVVVDTDFPEAWRREPYLSTLCAMSRDMMVSGKFIYVYVASERYMILPDKAHKLEFSSRDVDYSLIVSPSEEGDVYEVVSEPKAKT